MPLNIALLPMRGWSKMSYGECCDAHPPSKRSPIWLASRRRARVRMAGVPASMGGVTTGRQAVVDQFRATAGDSTFALKQMFGDDKHVCVIGRVAAERFPDNASIQGAAHPYSTYE